MIRSGDGRTRSVAEREVSGTAVAPPPAGARGRLPRVCAIALAASAVTCGGSDNGVAPPPAPVLATITITPNPAILVAGASQQLNAVGRDASGNVVTLSPTWSVVGGGGTVNSSGLLTADTTVGTHANAIVAASGSVSTAASIIVTPAAAAKITVNAGNNQSALVGSAVVTPPSVKVVDSYGNPVSGVPVAFVVEAGGGTITAAGPSTDVSGVATVGSWTLGPSAGTNTLSVTVAGLANSPLVFTATGTARPVVPVRLALTTPPSESAPDRTVFSRQPVIELQGANAEHAPVPGAVVTATLGGGGVLNGTTSVVTTTAGTATFTDLSISGATGPHTITFASPGLASVSAPVALTPGAPTSFRIIFGDAQSAPVGGLVGVIPSIQLTDIDNNGVSGVPVHFAVTAGGGVVVGGDPMTNVNGVAVIGSWTLGPSVGANTLSASASGAPGSPLTFHATATSGFDILDIAGGGAHSCAIAPNGTAYCWGDDYFGQLGIGSDPAGRQTTRAAVAGGITFKSVTAGYGHSCGLTAAGVAYCWGRNDRGQLGVSGVASSNVPVAVSGGLAFQSLAAGQSHTCGLTTSGAAYCWGDNFYNQLGDTNRTSNSRSAPSAVLGNFSFTSIAAGMFHTCALTSAGAAYCWGANGSGQLGSGSTSLSEIVPVAVVGGMTFQRVDAGWSHTCGLTTGGAAYCWGDNKSGDLGDGTSIARASPVAVSGGLVFQTIAVGGAFSCGVAGQTYCWGDNTNGMIGDGTTVNRSVPTRVAGGITFNLLAAGDNHVCGRATSGIAYCWGSNGAGGQLGDGSLSNRLIPDPVH